ncbi:GtrA family protein [Aliiroseovarius subalbicans]|uniref:GtrA family protein n=1 Tax=Aliiroseovarius subalbicans TaxID=2925840 RepID=UPI001F57777B|nr:GtrA family protein [Aliiroseovarius subalbicans]MCI2400427.1 GtrA family protein [Aliiroseovarius subalbicans]
MFLRFLFFSGSAALVNLLTGQLLYGALKLNAGAEYAFSVAVAFLSGMLISYVLNRRYTFPPSGKEARDEVSVFFLVSIGGLLLTTGIAHSVFFGAPAFLQQVSTLMPGKLSPETLAHVIGIGMTAVYSFFAHRDISFRRKAVPKKATISESARGKDIGET